MSYLQFTKDDIMRGAEMGVMALLGLDRHVHGGAPAGAPDHYAGGHAARTGALNRRSCRRDRTVPAPAPALPPAAGGSNVNIGGGGSITSTGGPNVSIVGGDEAVAISNRTSAMIDIAKVQGQVHAQSVQKVGELADKNPHEAVSIIRNWLHEDAA